jgi:hypothetical protein
MAVKKKPIVKKKKVVAAPTIIADETPNEKWRWAVLIAVILAVVFVVYINH